MEIIRCSECGYQMIDDEVWVADDMGDNRVYCFTHAPDDAIRLKDIAKAEPVSKSH